LPGDGLGHARGNQFEHDGESSRLRQGLGIGQQFQAFGLAFALEVVAVFLPHMLRQHSQVPQERDAGGHDCPDLIQNLAAALGFDGFRPGSDQAPGVGQRVRRGCVASEGQVGGQQGARAAPGGGADVVLHFGHGDGGGVRVAQHHHSQRVAHQDQGNAGLVQEAGRRKVVGG